MTAPGLSYFIDSQNRYYNHNNPGAPTYTYAPPEEVFSRAYVPALDPWHQISHQVLLSAYEASKNRFVVNVNAKHFEPNELSVKTADGFVFIIMKHEGKKEGQCAWESCEVIRKYQLPEGCLAEDVECRVSPDGHKTVFVRSLLSRKCKEREVPIIFTEPVTTRSETRDVVTEAQRKPVSADVDASKETPVKNDD